MSDLRAWTAALLSAAVAVSLTGSTTADAASTAVPAERVVGAQTSGDSLFPSQGNGGYDVKDYDLAIAWSVPNSIAVTATITAATTGAALSSYSLDLEGLTVSAVTVDGVAATFTRVASGAAHKLVVTPATPVGGTFVTKVTYSGTPTTHTDPDGSSEGWVRTTDGAVALNEPVGAMTWYPNNNTPADKATYTTRITVPFSALPVGNRIAVSTGRLTSTTTTASTRTFTWTQTGQQAPYLSMVAIGLFTAAESDVALRTGTTPEWTYSDPTAAGSTQIATVRAKLSPILQALEGHYGPYPGVATGLVLDVSSLGYALETQDRPYFENSIDDETLVHELAHQWFGNAVSPRDWGDIWLNEGPATFMATQVLAELAGTAPTTGTQATYYESWRSSSPTSTMWTTPAAGFDDPADLFGTQVYLRGAIALEALRSSLGDAVFIDVMRTWIETYGGGSATTAQFEALAESVSGYDLTAFFQDWVHDADKPAAWPAAYELSLASSPATGATVGDGSTVSYTLTAANTGAVPTDASVVEVDASDLVAQGALAALPAGVTRQGDTLAWAVPSTPVGGTASTTVTAVLDRATGGALTVRTRGRTLGADCGTCASTLTVTSSELASATPTITGTPRVDSVLTAAPGAWDPAATLAYQWRVAGTLIAGATSMTYTPRPADVGEPLSVAVTGTRSGSTPVTRTSDAVTVALAVQTRRPRPTITGRAVVGRRLTARPGAHDPGVRLRYQWFVGGRTVPGATSPTYVVRPRDRRRSVRVTTAATKPGYVTVAKSSLPRRVRA
ncbi:MAG: hypothetical protein JWN84_3221 [Nocardioides sp.]|nr:hypothetical protein [Nocardioides sp.]